MARPRKENKMKNINITLTPNLYSFLEDLAKKYYQNNKSKAIRALLKRVKDINDKSN